MFLNSEYTTTRGQPSGCFFELIVQLLVPLIAQNEQGSELHGHCFFLFSHLAMANILLLSEPKAPDPATLALYERTMSNAVLGLASHCHLEAVN